MFSDNLRIVLNKGGACDVYLGCNIVSGPGQYLAENFLITVILLNRKRPIGVVNTNHCIQYLVHLSFYVCINLNICTLTICFTFTFYVSEPNNESPLNTQAAELWSNQAAYKKLLLEKYEKDVRSKEAL